MRLLSVRHFTVAATLACAAASASALTLPTEALAANSIQSFSIDAQDQFNLFKITVTPLGNATAAAATAAYNLPVTSITINNQLKVAAGKASGSALEIARYNVAGVKIGVTLANFKIDFITHKVLADVTPIGGVTTPQMVVYTFNEATPLTLKYRFPLSVSGEQLLDKLYLTPEGITAIATALALPRFAPALMAETDFGNIAISVKVGLRKPVSSKPYVPAN